MIHPSDTPPDGDFAAYVERLTAVKAAPGKAPASPSLEAAPGQLARKPQALDGGAKISFSRHVKWALGLWVAAQVLAVFVPGAGFWFVPGLMLYAAWVIFIIRRQPPGAFLKALRELARRAAEPAQKSARAQPKNKP